MHDRCLYLTQDHQSLLSVKTQEKQGILDLGLVAADFLTGRFVDLDSGPGGQHRPEDQERLVARR